MRVLLVCPIRDDFPQTRGIVNKMRYQARALAELFGECEVLVNSFDGPKLDGSMFARYPVRGRGWNTLNHYGLFWGLTAQHLDPARYDVVYVRYPGATPVFVSFLAWLRARNRRLKVVLEVPTYPFRAEMKTAAQKLIMLADDVSSPLLPRVVDRVVTFFGQREIYGIPAVCTQNGIDLDSVPLRKPLAAQPPETLRLVGVANLAAWHGYDRVLQGLAADRDARITFRIVGDGPEAPQLRALTERLGLSERVSFLGVMTGQALDAVFDSADVAVGSLGMHRLALGEASSLKTREYCARGIPFILGSPDEDFPDGRPYWTRVPANDEPLDIHALLEWARSLPLEPGARAAAMRADAEARLTWTAKLRPVRDALATAQ